MTVGHNPGLEELVAQIVLPIDQWRDLTLSTRGTLVRHWRPKQLT